MQKYLRKIWSDEAAYRLSNSMNWRNVHCPGNYVEDPGCNTVNLASAINNNNLENYNFIILNTELMLDNDWDCLHYIDYVQFPVMIYCTNAMLW